MKNYEGKVFRAIHTHQLGSSVWICFDHYTAKDLSVYEIKQGSLHLTSDKLESLDALEVVGEYDPSKPPADIPAKTLRLSELLKKA